MNFKERYGVSKSWLKLEYGIPSQACIEYALASQMHLSLDEIRSLSGREVDEFLDVIAYIKEKEKQEIDKNKVKYK